MNGGESPRFFLGEALPTQDTIRQNNNCLGMNQNEATARVHIDAQLKQQGWDMHNPNSVRNEVFLEDSTRADYVLCDRHGQVRYIEFQRFTITAKAQGTFDGYCQDLLQEPHLDE